MNKQLLIPVDGPLAKVTLSSWDDTVRLDRVEVKLERASVDDVREAAKVNPEGCRELAEYLAKKSNVKIPWAEQSPSDSEEAYKRNRIGFGANQ
jgi:hypothetical protein